MPGRQRASAQKCLTHPKKSTLVSKGTFWAVFLPLSKWFPRPMAGIAAAGLAICLAATLVFALLCRLACAEGRGFFSLCA